MPDNSQLFGLLGLGKGGGGGGGHHHHHGGGRGRFRGGGPWFGPGYYWGDPILVAEDVSTIIPPPARNGAAPKVGAKIYAEAIAMKTRAEHGDSSLQEVWNGQDKQVLHEPDLPKATDGYMWVFHSGPSRRTGAPGNWIMYVRSGRK